MPRTASVIMIRVFTDTIFSITNSSGGEYKQLNLTAKQTVDLGMKNLPVGVYFLQFKTLTGRKIRGKLLKQK